MAGNTLRLASRTGVALMAIAAGRFIAPAPGPAQVRSENAPPEQQAEELDIKSESTALWLSLGGTVVPLAVGTLLIAGDDSDGGAVAGSILAGAGLYFGPALGYWYGGAAGRGWKGVGIRFGTGLVTGLASVLICGEDCDLDSAEFGAAGIVTLIGGVAILGSAVYDIGKVKSHVREANDAKRANAARLSIAPILTPAGGGTAGVVARLTF